MTLGFYKISARLDSEKLHLKTIQMEGVNLEKCYNRYIVLASRMAPQKRKHKIIVAILQTLEAVP